jgi:hypothetical protein
MWYNHTVCVTTPLLEECEDDIHTHKMGTWESWRTPKVLEFHYMGQNTLHLGVFYILGKLSKCRCRKWAHMSHLDMSSTSYGKKKGRESNWHFDSRPLKVRNRPGPNACKWSAIHHWKDLNKIYKFALEFIPIGGLSRELWSCKIPGVQTRIILGLLLGNPGTKSHSDVSAMKRCI